MTTRRAISDVSGHWVELLIGADVLKKPRQDYLGRCRLKNAQINCAAFGSFGEAPRILRAR
jgi:hypothetical protein